MLADPIFVTIILFVIGFRMNLNIQPKWPKSLEATDSRFYLHFVLLNDCHLKSRNQVEKEQPSHGIGMSLNEMKIKKYANEFAMANKLIWIFFHREN